MLVVVIAVRGVPVTVVHVVHMVAVGHGDMPTTIAVRMVMSGMRVVPDPFAFVEVTVVPDMKVSIMDIVDMVIVRNRDVATGLTVHVVMSGVFAMSS